MSKALHFPLAVQCMKFQEKQEKCSLEELHCTPRHSHQPTVKFVVLYVSDMCCRLSLSLYNASNDCPIFYEKLRVCKFLTVVFFTWVRQCMQCFLVQAHIFRRLTVICQVDPEGKDVFAVESVILFQQTRFRP